MTLRGVDTMGALDPNAMKAAGYFFVCRYLSNTPSKNLIMGSAPYDRELQTYLQNGIDVVCNWEATGQLTTTNHPGDPYGQGFEDASRAQKQLDLMNIGYAPCYFSIDYAIQPSEYSNLALYFQACIAVMGLSRVGAYISGAGIGYLFDHNLITWGWQNNFGSAPKDSRAHIFQDANAGTAYIGGIACDIDYTLPAGATDFGQLPRPSVAAPAPQTVPVAIIPGPAGGGTPTSYTDPGPATIPAGSYAGVALTAEQTGNASTVLGVAKGRNESDNVCVAMMAAAMQESSIRNLTFGSGTSLGIFQLIDSHGTVAQREDVVFSSNWWCDQVDLIADKDTRDPGALAQAVEVSAFPTAYAKWVPMGRALVSTYDSLLAARVAPVPVPVTAPTPTPDPTPIDPTAGGTSGGTGTGLGTGTGVGAPTPSGSVGSVITHPRPSFSPYTPDGALFTTGRLDSTSGWALSGYAEAALRQTSTVTFRVNAYLNDGGIGHDLPISGGSVTYDATQAVGRRSASLSISDPALWPTQALAPLAPMGTELSIEYGFGLPNGTVEWVPLMRGPITDVSSSRPWSANTGGASGGASAVNAQQTGGGSNQAAIAVTVQDRSIIIADDGFDVATSTVATEKVVVAIVRLITEVLPTVTVTDYTLNTTLCPVVDLQQDRWGAITKLAGSIGAECYADRLGNFVIRPQATLANKPRWRVDVGANGVLVQSDLAYSRDGVYNRVYASGQATTSTDVGGTTTNVAPPFAVAVDDNPTHANYYGGPFGKRTRHFVSPLLATTGQCQQAANAILARAEGMHAAVTLAHVPNPALDPGDVVVAEQEEGVQEVHIIDSMQIPLSPSGAQSLNTRVQALPPESQSADPLTPLALP